MPFSKAQSVLKKILPISLYQPLYNVACNGWDVYQKVSDRFFYIPPLVYYLMTGNERGVRKITIVQTCLPYTMISRVGLDSTYDIAKSATQQGIKGAFVECGVARGGSSALMALIAQDEGRDRKTWLFDSFEGLPKQSEVDGVQKPVRHKNRTANDLAEGYCYGSIKDVEGLIFTKLKLSHHNVCLIKGWFQDTLPLSKSWLGDIAVLRLDGDWYESTKCCLENLYGNVVQGGYVIIDDYTLAGCKMAVDEFRVKMGMKGGLMFDKNGRSYWRK